MHALLVVLIVLTGLAAPAPGAASPPAAPPAPAPADRAVASCSSHRATLPASPPAHAHRTGGA